MFEPILGTLTVKNGTMYMTEGFVVEDGGHLMLLSVDLTMNCTTAEARPAVKLSRAGNTKLTVRDSYLKTLGPGESLILVEHGTDGIVNIEGNSTLEYAGELDAEPQNCGVFAIQQAWGSGVDQSAASSNTDAIINIGRRSVIKATAPSSTSSSHISALVALSSAGDVTLNLESDAELLIDRIAGMSKSTHINRVSFEGGVTINDKGAKWSVSAKALRGSNVLLTDITTDGKSILGWTDGTELIRPNTAFGVADAVDNVSYTPVTFNQGDFYMLEGAAIREIDGQNAIRFPLSFPMSCLISLRVSQPLVCLSRQVR